MKTKPVQNKTFIKSSYSNIISTFVIMIIIVITATGCEMTMTPDPNQNQNNNGNSEPFQFSQAFDASGVGFLSAIWGADENNIFIVGGTRDNGEAYKFDGNIWKTQQIPEVDALIWVYGFSDDDVYAVGESGNIIHCDGTSWTKMESPTTQDLWGVWGTSSNNIWAVGGNLDQDGFVILRYDGNTWTEEPQVSNDRNAKSLFKVWGTSENNVIAVGDNGLILRFNGIEWTQESSNGASDDIISLWGNGPNNIVAVGGRSNGVILHYDGQTWTGGIRTGVAGLNGVFVNEDGNAVVCGINGEAGLYNPTNDTYNAENSKTNVTLHAVWSFDNQNYYVIGGINSGVFTGLALLRSNNPQVMDNNQIPE